MMYVCKACRYGFSCTDGKSLKSVIRQIKLRHKNCKKEVVITQSRRFTLNKKDLKKWAFNVFRFVVIPTVIAFFTALQGQVDIKVAYGVAVGTLYTSLVDLGRKFLNGKK